jgi:hypothetical protein
VAEQDDMKPTTGNPDSDGEQIVTIIPADSGWRAIYGGQGTDESGLSRVIAWALVERGDGQRRIVGMVVDPQDRTNIVTVDGTESQHAGSLTGYGYKER